MKYYFNKKKLRSFNRLFAGCMLLGSTLSGCTKWDDLNSPVEGKIYMPQAYSNRSELTVYRIDDPQVFTFGAAVAGFNGAAGNIAVDFEVDNSLIEQFNLDHSYLNYDFVPLPEDAFTLSSLQSTIPDGSSDSEPLSIEILANKLDPSLDYCLPIRIKSATKGTIDSVLNTTYFMIDSLFIRSKDVTGLGILTVAKDNNDGADAKEGSKKLVDDDYDTKYLYEYEKDTWMQLKMNEPVKLNAYTLTSGNDAEDRDPRIWKFQGSNDGSTWTTLDSREDFKFTGRKQTVTFELNQSDDKEYTYYRLLVNENNGSSLLQITEWRLVEYY